MNHLIIDLTMSLPNVELDWCLLGGEATGSDHEVLRWGVAGNLPTKGRYKHGDNGVGHQWVGPYQRE